MKSYKETKEELLNQTDYRNFTYRMTRLPEMIEAQSKNLDDILAQFKEEGFNHLSVVELCRAFVEKACREFRQFFVGGDVGLHKVAVYVFAEGREYLFPAYLAALHCVGYER